MTILYHSHESLFLRWRGTVLPRTWKLTFFTGALALGLCYVYDLERKTVKRGGEASMSFHLFHDAEAFFGLATTFVTFILGFFNSNVYGRWWKLRELVGTVVGKSNDTALLLATYCDGEDPASRKSVREIVRYLGLAQAVLYLAARGEDNEEGLDSLCQKKNASGQAGQLLQKGSKEYKALQSCACAKYSVVYGWLMRTAKHAAENGHLKPMPDTVLYMINMNVSMARGAAADVIMYRNTPIPIAYTHLLEVFVKIYVLIAPVALVPLLLWMAPPVVMLVTFFFYGFLKLGRMMFNPFKDEADSFPTAEYLDDTIDTMVEMIKWIPVGVPTPIGASGESPCSSPGCQAEMAMEMESCPNTPMPDFQDVGDVRGGPDLGAALIDSLEHQGLVQTPPEITKADGIKLVLPPGAVGGASIETLRQRPSQNSSNVSCGSQADWRRASLC